MFEWFRVMFEFQISEKFVNQSVFVFTNTFLDAK